jgi:hypothetical protein
MKKKANEMYKARVTAGDFEQVHSKHFRIDKHLALMAIKMTIRW